MSTEIQISKGGETITMPRTREITYGGTEVSIEATMADGSKVSDVIGFRPNFQAHWDWVPASKIRALNTLLRRGGYFTVTYPAPDGTRTEAMRVSFPAMEVFKFQDGVAVWHNITLDAEAKDVIRDAANT